MRFGQAALLGGLSLLLVGPAQAGGWTESCDWFENAIVGARCAQSFAVSTALHYGSYSYNNSAWNSAEEYYIPSGTLAVTPTSWLTLSFGSQYRFDDQHGTHNGAPFDLTRSYAVSQLLEANANVIDTGRGASRFVLNAYFGGAVVPAHDGIDGKESAFGGLVANWQYQLGSSGYSIAARGSLEADSWASNGNVYLYPDARLLLSNDKLGIAAGPVFRSANWLSSDGTVSSQSSDYYLGGTVVAEPFRSSQSAFLNGIILQATGLQSIGQTNFVPSSTAKTSEFDVTGTVGFHFRY